MQKLVWLFCKYSSRQVDILIDSRFAHGLSRRIIVDAKYQKRRIDVKQVEEFEGMMRDVSAHHGILVCPSGYSKGALKRAQETITIKLVLPEELEEFNFGFDICQHHDCNGFTLWDFSPSLEINGLMTIFATGKCDQCFRFNIWCWACGERFTLDSEDEYQCSCKDCWDRRPLR